LNISMPGEFARIQYFVLVLLFAIVLGAITCSSNDGEGEEQISIQIPTIAPEQRHLIEVGGADYLGCTGIVELGDVARAAGAQVVLREDPNRFNLGVPGDADILGILAVCVLEFLSASGDGEPGTTITLRSTSFLSDEGAAVQFKKLQVSANTIVANLEPNASLAADSLGPNSYLLTANDDRLGAIAAFLVKNTVTQLSTTMSDDGLLLLDIDQLQELAMTVRANLSAGD
jgi:hypothetical protein